MQNKNLSEHFALSEFVRSSIAEQRGIDNTPSAEAVANLQQLCDNTLEPLRQALGLPVVITSGYRCQALNSMITHHAEKSQHLTGRAADFHVGRSQADDSKSSRELLIRAFRQVITDDSIDYDQLILYPSFIHVSFVSRAANRHKLIRANGNGKYCCLTREQALSIN